MTDDLVTRLLKPVMIHSSAAHTNAERREAAATITTLRARVETLENRNEILTERSVRLEEDLEFAQARVETIRNDALKEAAFKTALQTSQGETSSPSARRTSQNNAETMPNREAAGVGGETNLPDWEQDQAETSRLPRTSSDGGVAPGETVADKRSSADASASSGDSVVAGVLPGPSDHLHRASFTARLEAAGASSPAESVRNAAQADYQLATANYIKRLEQHFAAEPVRDMGEAQSWYYRSLFALQAARPADPSPPAPQPSPAAGNNAAPSFAGQDWRLINDAQSKI